MRYINRAIEDILKNRFETFKSVAITGARQVGKTTMTKHIYSDVKRINLKNVVLYLEKSSNNYELNQLY